MTTQPATRQGDAPPRYLVTRHRRRQRYEAATRQDALTQLERAIDLARAAAIRRRRDGDEQAVRYLAAVIANLATDIDRRTP